MANVNQVGQRATTIKVDDNGYTCITYHSTDVVKFNSKQIILNTGGWQTHTTKTRMNQASNQFKLGFKVYQKDYDWFAIDKLGCVLRFGEFETLTIWRI
jgi:hypothetical protein